MVGIFKLNEVTTVGGTTPQGEGVALNGEIKDWTVVEVPDDKISSIQEFDIQYVADDFVEKLNGPQQEGAYNAPAFEIGGTGDKLRPELNPDQFVTEEDGTKTRVDNPDDADDKSQKNFNSNDVAGYKEVYNYVKKFTEKSVLRDNIRMNIKDVEDDIADSKVAIQTALYYFANEWKTRNESQRKMNPKSESMDRLTNKLLSNEVKMRADLENGSEKLSKILKDEEAINNLIEEKYKYNSERGL